MNRTEKNAWRWKFKNKAIDGVLVSMQKKIKKKAAENSLMLYHANILTQWEELEKKKHKQMLKERHWNEEVAA